jgi:hypothetical protein
VVRDGDLEIEDVSRVNLDRSGEEIGVLEQFAAGERTVGVELLVGRVEVIDADDERLRPQGQVRRSPGYRAGASSA